MSVGTVMSELSLQAVIVVAFGVLCFGCGCILAFIVTRNRYRKEMIKRGLARYNQQTGKWEWGKPPKEESKYPVTRYTNLFKRDAEKDREK